MNPKIEKLQAERARNTEKITALQTRVKQLDGQITELENTDIVGLVRESGLTPDMLAELLKAMRNNTKPIQPVSYNEMEDKNEEN